MAPVKGTPAINQINASMQSGVANNDLLNRKGGNELPSTVGSALLPDMAIAGHAKSAANEDKFNISVKDVPARQFFMGLVKGTNENMLVSPKVGGDITLELKNVTVEEALEAVHTLYGYQYKKTDFGYEILPGGLQTRIFKVNYLDVVRDGKSSTLISSGQITRNNINSGDDDDSSSSSGTSSEVSPASSVETLTKSDFWKELTVSLKAIIGDTDGREVIVNPDAGLVIVKAYPAGMSEVARYLDSVQSSMTREVIIDAKVLEVQLANGYQAGIDWNALGLSQVGIGTLSATGNTLINNGLKAFTSVFSGKASARGDSFDILVNLLSTQGNVQVLSSPRIATLNNQKAVIKVGTDEFFITNVENTTVGTGTSTETSQDIDFTPFFSGIALDVTPEIAANGDVILHIHPIVSKVTAQSNDIVVSGKEQNFPLALSQIRESDSIVRAKSGQVVVIGGLMENKTEETNANTPFLAKLPIVGHLFRRTNQQSSKVELVILLKPIVVGQGSWNKVLTKDAQRFREMNRGFTFGSHVHVFGNLGEPGVKKK
jgi:MSHA biogenesis protein MshL